MHYSHLLANIPGFAASGTIVGLGAGCAPRLKVGDKVWGVFPWDYDPVKGAQKEYGTVSSFCLGAWLGVLMLFNGVGKSIF